MGGDHGCPLFLWVWVVWGLFVFSAVVQHCYVIQLMLAFSANPVLQYTHTILSA